MSALLLAALAALDALTPPACAQTFPAKPIRIVVGPGPDIVARVIGQKLTEAWGQQIVVDTRPGGGGNIAADMVAKATPDGYTLLLASATYPINTAMQTASYDLLKDFAAVVFCASAPFILVVHPSLPVRSVADLIALAKSKPGQINYASAGNGTPPHLAGEMFKTMAQVDIVHVPYKGAAAGMIDLVGGQVQMMMAIASATLGQIHAGKVRALAVSSARRTRLAPDLPTIAEAGLPGFEVIGWNGLIAPAGTPAAVIDKVNAEALRALKQNEVRTRLVNAGYDPADDNTPAQFTAYIKSEIAKWSKLVKESGAKAD
ncbi:MAG TPA: tripartite tricarboxylate transporter substrate binding protein [Burkholderiales bacterium]|nr:tripartite tricarboxylate transporter substrate binding protein [Burkholderiales bacterium]